MATRWRCWLTGDDHEHLEAIVNWWADEIDRWDRLLSKFDPASEVTRCNRAPPLKKLKLQRDLFDLLNFCEQARLATQGLFDITASSWQQSASQHETKTAAYQLDLEQQLFQWFVAERQLDFGGVAKGYVLDQLAPALREHGVTAALLDAGGSSLLTWDSAAAETAWQVSLAPANDDPTQRVFAVNDSPAKVSSPALISFRNAALSYSATRAPGTSSGQTIDPRVGAELPKQRACVVMTQSAAWAEVLSTAALCMGEAGAAEYIKEGDLGASLGWIDENTVRWHDSATPI